MTTVQYLSQIRKLDKMINNRLKEIDELRIMAENVSSMKLVSDVVKTSGRTDQLERIVVKIIDAEHIVDNLVDRYVDKRKEITEQIESMEYVTYNVLFLRFMLNYTFSNIAKEMNGSERQIYRWYKTGIVEFEEKYGMSYKNI